MKLLSRRSAASRADRAAGSLPPLSLPPLGAKALRVSAWALLHTVALTGIGGGLWWRHINQVPVIVVPETPIISPNGYPALIAATGKLRREKEVGDAMVLPKILSGASAAVQPGKKVYTLADKTALVAENADALKAMRAALQLPAQAPPIRDFNTPYPELAKFRQMARLLSLEGQVHEANGRYVEAASSYLNAMELGERIGHGGVLIHKLVAIACEAIGRRGLLLVSDKLPSYAASAAARRVEDLQARRSGMDDALTEEKWATQAEFNRWFRKQSLGQTVGLMVGESLNEEGVAVRKGFIVQVRDAAWMLRYSKTEIATAHGQYMNRLIADSKLPYDRSRPTPELPPDFLNQMLLPVFTQAHHKEADSRAQNALLTTKLALAAYRGENSQLPADLDVLVAGGYLHAKLVDPFAKNGTDALHYAQVSPTEYRLYSVGPDGADNNGIPIPPDKTNKNKRWTNTSDNGDFVLGVNYF